MKNIETIKTHYLNQGVKEENIQYAIEAVKDGGKREHIIENLTADYRGMQTEEASRLLEELFAANGGEFKKENRGGYLYGIFFLAIGLACSYYLFYVYTYGGVLVRPILIWAGAILCTFCGIVFIIKAMMGKYRDTDEPFKDYNHL
jgi:hypothetical protein